MPSPPTPLQSICVFCGSSPGARADYLRAAEQLGQLLAVQGRTLVYGGGRVGLMGAVADAALAAGGRVVGVIPEALQAKEVGHRGLTELHVVNSMHERKAMMAQMAGGFVALPGGLGTYEELLEIATWGQLGIHQKPCGILNVAGFYDHLLAMLDHAVAERFVRPEHREMILVESDAETLLTRMDAWEPSTVAKWMDLQET